MRGKVVFYGLANKHVITSYWSLRRRRTILTGNSSNAEPDVSRPDQRRRQVVALPPSRARMLTGAGDAASRARHGTRSCTASA